MTNAIEEIVAQLDRQREAIDTALSALRELGDVAPRRGPRHPSATKTAVAKRKSGISAEGRRRLAESMKRRWALKRSAARAKRADRRKQAA